MGFTKSQESEIQKITKNAIKECFSDTDFMDMLADKFASVITKKLEEQVAVLTIKCDKMESHIQKLNNVNKELHNKLDFVEQQLKNSYIRIYGVPESKNENLIENLIVENVFSKLPNLQLDSKSIEMAYRVGKPNNKKTPRPIFLKLTSQSICSKILQNRKLMKNTKIFIAEELTKKRYELLSLAKEKLGKTNAWSMQGKIYAKKNGKVSLIFNMEDLENLLQ